MRSSDLELDSPRSPKRRSAEPRKISSELSVSLGAPPPPESVVKSSKGQKIEKLCGLAEWEPRFICVTNDKFLILHSENDEEIADQIPLVFISLRFEAYFELKRFWPARDQIIGSNV